MKEARARMLPDGRVARGISKLRMAVSLLEQGQPRQDPCSATEFLRGVELDGLLGQKPDCKPPRGPCSWLRTLAIL